MKTNNSEKETIYISQSIYDSFNNFIFSNDTRILAKVIARTLLFEKIKNVPGDIIECGVFKGSGILSWLKIKNILAPNSFKKVIGFDYFDTDSLLNSLTGKEKETMTTLFEQRKFKYDEQFINYLKEIILNAGFHESDFELIKGDLSETARDFVIKRPGAKISLLYLDVDLEKPTYDALKIFWNRISKGGIIVFDEYGYHQWSESLGVDRFCEEYDLDLIPLNFNTPTAYIIKK